MNESDVNGQLKSFLIGCREKAGQSQSDVAARSDLPGFGRVLDQKTVSRLENSPLSADTLKLKAYMSAVGIDPNDYFQLVHEITHKNGGRMTSSSGSVMNSEEIVLNGLKKVSEAAQVIEQSPHTYIQDSRVEEQISNAANLIRSLTAKPIIGFFGGFDSAKSTAGNSILGEELLPARYQPATSVVNIIMHTSDRPASMQSQVAIFKQGFMAHMIHSQERVDEYLIEQGDASILKRLGTHDYEAEEKSDAYISVAFSDAEILKTAWLMDTPGDMNSADEQDAEKALAGAEFADGIVYVSPITGFMKDSDIGLSANVLRNKPPIDPDLPFHHILFLQSHCHSEVSSDQVEQVRQTVFKRTSNKFNVLLFDSWLGDGAIDTLPNAADLADRTVPFWRENETYLAQTRKAVNDLANYLALKREAMVEAKVKGILEGLSGALSAEIGALESKKQATAERMSEVEEQDARFRSESQKTVRALKELTFDCDNYQRESKQELKDFFDRQTRVEALTETIKQFYDNKKEAQQGIGDYIGQRLTARTETVLKRQSRDISKRLDALLERWQNIVPHLGAMEHGSDMSNVRIDQSAFNAKAAFIGGLSGLGSLGAMALWVASIGSNLGGYILIGKLAGILVSLGLASSVTAVTSFVAAIGGPITVGITFAAVIGLVVYRLAGASWEKALAKKVAAAIEEKKVWDDLANTVDTFWEQTKVAMSAGVDALIADTETYIEKLKKEAATEFSSKDLDYCIDRLGETKDKLRA